MNARATVCKADDRELRGTNLDGPAIFTYADKTRFGLVKTRAGGLRA